MVAFFVGMIMSSKAPIEPGKKYWATIDDVRFRVKANKPAAVPGWWLCETDDGDRIMMQPEHLAEIDPAE